MSEFQKSSSSLSTNCVEVAAVKSSILVRDSKDPAGAVLAFTSEEWVAFIRGDRAGEFDFEKEAG